MGGRDANVVDDEDEHRIHPPRSIDDYLDSAYCHGGDRVGRTYHVIFLALGLANSGDSAEISCTNYVLSSSSFRNDILFGDDRAMRGSAIAGAHFAGMFLSGLLAGPLADVRGRRSIILLGLTSNSIVGVLSSCVYTAPQLVVLRFVTGLGLGMVIGGVVALAAELSPPGSRGRYMTLVSSCYTLGFLYSSFWALLIFRGEDKHDETNDGGGGMGYGNWRWFIFVNALPTMIAAILVAAYVPESPRFYLCRGRLAEAVRVANRIARAMMGRRECRESDDGKKCDLLTEGELRLYLCVSGTDGPRGGGGIDSMTYDLVDEHANSGGGGGRLRRYDQFRKEIRTSISSFGRVFANGYWRTTVPLQLCYFSLTLVTGER
jgi:MFS family permease